MAKTPSNHRKAWTGSDNQQLRKLAKQNTPTPLIAWKMKRTEDAIRNQAAEIDLSLKPTNKSPRG
jgi:ribosomal protein L39E